MSEIEAKTMMSIDEPTSDTRTQAGQNTEDADNKKQLRVSRASKEGL